MAQGSLTLSSGRDTQSNSTADIDQQSYIRAVLTKLYQDKLSLLGIILIVFMVSSALSAPWVADNVLGFEPNKTNLRARSEPPTWAADAWPVFQEFASSCAGSGSCQWGMWGEIFRESVAGLGDCLRSGYGNCHWLGTDQAGRDVLTRGLYGGRVSLRIGLYVAVITIVLGVTFGLISGYYAATFIDDAVNAIIMTISSIPDLFLLIILARIFQPGPEGLAFLVAILGGWMGLSRVIRGQIFSLREREYILASRATGSSPWRIMFSHVLPNVSSIIIVNAIFILAGAILIEAGLSYLGVGIQPPTASWGNMMKGSLGNFTDAPWLVLTPGIFIFFTNLGILLLGDGLRDALDPWVKK